MSKPENPFVFATNRELRPWEQMLVESIKTVGDAEELVGKPVEYACMVAKLGDGHMLTGFCDVGAFELAEAAVHLLFDGIDHFIEANIDKYMALYNADDELSDYDEEEDRD